MKSNLILSSESRELLGRNISVMSKDGFVCITEVMEVLNENVNPWGWSLGGLIICLLLTDFKKR